MAILSKMKPSGGFTKLSSNSHRMLLSCCMALAVGSVIVCSICFRVNPLEQRGLEEKTVVMDEFAGREMEQRNAVRYDEFWLTESEQAFLPFDIEYTPPDEDWYKESMQQVWTCSDPKADNGRPKKLVFVHMVRTMGDMIQDLLNSYATSCRAGIATAVMCSGLSWESMIAGSWTNRNSLGGKDGKCVLKEGTSRSGNKISKTYIQNDWLEEKVDILTGQIPLGCHEKWKKKRKEVKAVASSGEPIVDANPSKEVVEAQYIVSFRDPLEWFITGMIEKQQDKEDKPPSTDGIVDAIKRKVDKDLSAGLYHQVFSRYLITPQQLSWISVEQADLGVEHRTGLALRNIVENKAVIVLPTEDMDGSLEKIQHLIGADSADIEALLQKERKEKQSTSSSKMMKVLERLKKDEALLQRLEKYLMYEKRIYDEAKSMHERQLQWLRESKSNAQP